MRPLKVLFCDDQPEIHLVSTIRQSACQFLGKLDSPRELFTWLHEHPDKIPDLLFLDARFNTREIDQQFNELRDMLEELRAYDEWHGIRVVILTGVPIRELFQLTYPYIRGFIDKADYQRAIPDAITVFTYGDADATFFNKFTPWKARPRSGDVWDQFTELQLSILDDCLRGHSDEFIQAKHGMRNHSNLSGRIDLILQRLMELSKRKNFFADCSDRSKGGLSIRQKFWIMFQICLELRHPAALEMVEKSGLNIEN
jgi:hypothetical protein